MDVIYVDALFFLNGVTDYLLLLSAARLRGLPLRRGRYLLAAGLGGLYAVGCVLPGCRALGSLPGKLLSALVMTEIAYARDPLPWKSALAFLGLAGGFAGAVTALGLLSGTLPGGVWVPVSLRSLLLSAGLCYAGIRLAARPRAGSSQREILSAEVVLRGRRASFFALRDTGNTLCDPVTGRGVLIADCASLSPLFPQLSLSAADCADAAALFRRLSDDPSLAGRLRLIPYSAVGTAGALLLCFRPDALTLAGAEAERLIAFSPTPLTGEYTAIV